MELAINLQLPGREQFTAEGALWIINLANKVGSQLVIKEVSIVKAIIIRTLGQIIDTYMAILNSVNEATRVAYQRC